MKILTAAQVKLCDKHTIASEQISSLELMERASETFCKWFTQEFCKEENPVVSIICGKGNNGGDGLATARILKKMGYEVEVFILEVFINSSDDFNANLDRLIQENDVKITHISKAEDLPIFDETEILIDAILGSGLTRNLDGELERIVSFINECNNIVVSMDIPSGMFADEQSFGTSIQADYTFTFEGPKFSFLLPDNFVRVGEFVYDSIGLDKKFIPAIITM